MHYSSDYTNENNFVLKVKKCSLASQWMPIVEGVRLRFQGKRIMRPKKPKKKARPSLREEGERKKDKGKEVEVKNSNPADQSSDEEFQGTPQLPGALPHGAIIPSQETEELPPAKRSKPTSCDEIPIDEA